MGDFGEAASTPVIVVASVENQCITREIVLYCFLVVCGVCIRGKKSLSQLDVENHTRLSKESILLRASLKPWKGGERGKSWESTTQISMHARTHIRPCDGTQHSQREKKNIPSVSFRGKRATSGVIEFRIWRDSWIVERGRKSLLGSGMCCVLVL